MRATQVVTFLALAKCFININNLEIIPESVKFLYVNPKYILNAITNVRRYGRNSSYYVNVEGTLLVAFDDNVTIDFEFYEYLHNEYKRTFVEMHFKGCKSVANDHLFFLSEIMKAQGISCPVLPGHYVFRNLTFRDIPAVDNLPYKWPFEKGKVVITTHTYPGNETITEAYGILSFKESRPNGKKKKI